MSRDKLRHVWCLDPVNSSELINLLRPHGRRVDFEVAWVGEGWRELVRHCHEQLAAAFPNYERLAIKQSWGVLEYQAFPYPWVEGGAAWPETDYRRLQLITGEFQGRSETACEWCGAVAQLRKWRTVELTLCADCDARFTDPPWPMPNR